MGKKKKSLVALPSYFSQSIEALVSKLPSFVVLIVGVTVALISFLIVVIWWILSEPSAPFSTPVPVVSSDESKEQQESIAAMPTIAPPKQRETIPPAPFLTASSALVIDVVSQQSLFTKNEKMQFWPASTTKIMTALVVLEHYSLDEIVTIHAPVAEGSMMGLVEGEKITVENLLYGLLIQSANDAAFALAGHNKEGVSGFVDLMNQKAVEVGLENTHFIDPAGFDNNKQFTTASDLARLSLFAINDKTIAKMVGIAAITISDTDYTRFHKLKNVNQLVGTVPGVAGVKTGQTENAKENLINLTKRNGDAVLTVLLGSEDRFSETRALTEWAFASFVWDHGLPTDLPMSPLAPEP